MDRRKTGLEAVLDNDDARVVLLYLPPLCAAYTASTLFLCITLFTSLMDSEIPSAAAIVPVAFLIALASQYFTFITILVKVIFSARYIEMVTVAVVAAVSARILYGLLGVPIGVSMGILGGSWLVGIYFGSALYKLHPPIARGFFSDGVESRLEMDGKYVEEFGDLDVEVASEMIQMVVLYGYAILLTLILISGSLSVDRSPTGAAVFASALSLAGGLGAIAIGRGVTVAYRAEKSGAVVPSSYRIRRSKGVGLTLSFLLLLATVLPSGISPLAKESLDAFGRELNQFMSGLNDRIAFLFQYRETIPSGPGIGTWLATRAAALVSAVMASLPQGSPGSLESVARITEFLFRLVLYGWILMLIYALIRYGVSFDSTRRDEATSLLRLLFTWPILLIYRILAAVSSLIRFLKAFLGVGGLAGPTHTARGDLLREALDGLRRRIFRVPDEPRERVRFFFGLLLKRSAKRGIVRRMSATVREYDQQLREAIDDDRGEELELTLLYQQARYSNTPLREEEAERAERYYRSLLRRLR